jgi:hypothetical protein
MNKLKVSFSNPKAGWVSLAIDDENEKLEIIVSHVFETFCPLTLALHRIWDEQGESAITLLGEPEQYVL